MEILTKLWAVADIEAKKANVESASVFDPIGLILIRPLRNMAYQSTPVNSISIAHTGGDGVHFSLISSEGKTSENSPVVMTVPMNFGKQNMILGENLLEFLCLGNQVGYSCLEQLTYNDTKAKTIEQIQYPENEIGKENGLKPCAQFHRKAQLLGVLRDSFGLKPWDKVEQRLNELQNSYMGILEFGPTAFRNRGAG